MIKIGVVNTAPVELRQFFVDWRRERDPRYHPENPPFPIRAPFVVVERGTSSPHLILEPESSTAVRCRDTYNYVGGGSFYGGRSYTRLEAPKVIVQLHRYSLDDSDPDNPRTWAYPKLGKRCPRHDPSSWARGWQVVLPGEEAKFEKHGLRRRDGSDDSYTYSIVEMSQAEFIQFLEGLPCACRPT